MFSHINVYFKYNILYILNIENTGPEILVSNKMTKSEYIAPNGQKCLNHLI